MEVIIFSIPSAAILIISIIVFVAFIRSDSHLDKMDTQTKIKLEEARKKTIAKINNKKQKGVLLENKNNSYEKLEHISKNKKIATSKLEPSKHTLKENMAYISLSQKNKKLEITRENLVRGIIASNYLDRKKRY